jgi:hypothetical protein
MPTADLDSLIKLIDEINKTAGFAYKYGPFYFAVALLILIPFVAIAVFKQASSHMREGRPRQNAYDDFRFYFRSTVAVGLACVVVGVGWWVFENFRQVQRVQETVVELGKQLRQLKAAVSEKKYAVVGVVMDGIRDHDEFVPTLNTEHTIVFSRVPPTNSLFFVVLSNEQIPNNLELIVSWRQFDETNRTSTRVVSLPIQVTVVRNTIGRYRFRFDKQIGMLQPL